MANGPQLYVSTGRANFTLTNANEIYSSVAEEGGAGLITSPMHGAIIEVLVSEGDTVKEGQRLAILEAMKMQHEILADIDGVVSKVNISTGQQIAANALMFEI